ncbi:MAG: hypothetical protein U9P50_00410 [Patescibacteria group bacterium]|nr:hypothetical protein [Patescibacteria group bacterium]
MLSFIDVSKDLHHAYLLEGERQVVLQGLLDFLNKKLNFSTTGNPDFWVGNFDSLGIDDSRAIKSFQSNKSFSDNKKILVIQTNFITHEAQNSLLKVFEEPTKNTHLFLIIPSAENLLPTLKSRLMIFKDLDVRRPSKQLGRRTSKLQAKDFLKANLTERLELIKNFLPKTKDEKISKSEIIDFLNKLEEVLYKDEQVNNAKLENIFSEIRKCRSYLNDRSPSVKMILEHLSQITLMTK